MTGCPQTLENLEKGLFSENTLENNILFDLLENLKQGKSVTNLINIFLSGDTYIVCPHWLKNHILFLKNPGKQYTFYS